jgi:hypothetical protein
MNERIRELAKQCWNERWEGQLHFDNEKFAELIVRECADLFEVEWGDEKLTGNDVGYVVKKHFGIDNN